MVSTLHLCKKDVAARWISVTQTNIDRVKTAGI